MAVGAQQASELKRIDLVPVQSGDPQHLTVWAHRLLREADAILHDFEVPPAVAALARDDAEWISAGLARGAGESWAPPVRERVIKRAREGSRMIWITGCAGAAGAARRAEMIGVLRAGGVEVDGEIPGGISAGDRERSRPAVIFLTGLSGAGKSTLALGLVDRLRRREVLAGVIDGDVLRAGLCRDLGFSSADRHENVRRASELALHLADIGAVAVVALISPFRADREKVAARAGARGIPYAEIYINAPLAVCERRDPKNLYRRARAGEIRSFTGIDSPYEAPLAPALELHTDVETIEESVERLAAHVLGLIAADAPAGGRPAP